MFRIIQLFSDVSKHQVFDNPQSLHPLLHKPNHPLLNAYPEAGPVPHLRKPAAGKASDHFRNCGGARNGHGIIT